MLHGDYIGFVDADDYLSPEMFNELFNDQKIIDTNPDLIRFQYQAEKGDLISLRVTDLTGYFDISNDKSVVFDLLINKCQIVNVFCCLYKREVLGDIRFNKEVKYGEDYLFNFNIFCKANSIFISPGIYYHYYINPASATHKVDPQVILRRLKNHFDVDYFVYNKLIEMGKYDSFKRITLDATPRAVRSVCKLIAKGLPYEEYEKILEELITKDFYLRYLDIPNNEENDALLDAYTSPTTRKEHYEEFKNM